MTYGRYDPQHLLAILFVNHQISDEAAAYFYGKTMFDGGCRAVPAFIKGVGARRRDLIRNVAIMQIDLLALPFDNEKPSNCSVDYQISEICASVPLHLTLQGCRASSFEVVSWGLLVKLRLLSTTPTVMWR